jgi:hypothetical protein
MKVTIFTIPRNGMKKLTKKLSNLKTNFKLKPKRKLPEEALRGNKRKKKLNKEEFPSNNKNKRETTKKLWRATSI